MVKVTVALLAAAMATRLTPVPSKAVDLRVRVDEASGVAVEVSGC